ncbi:phytanoyl-CoA dioxygenase family protein [uncultured Nostoc sp.]|uniref:phytanoyl-CoA dioxygenase family protein n=1 Tax=uncultured Nostoc sp. TaxID=340711 RepID=UPI0035CC2CB6
MVDTTQFNANNPSLLTDICTDRPLSKDQIAQYHNDGFVIIPSFFDPEEVEPIKQALEADPELGGVWTKWADSYGHLNQIVVWTELGDSLLGVIPRTNRMVNAAEILLEGVECYHWHSKLIIKNPHSKAWIEWHQGYGGWYNDGCLYPHFVTCTVAIDKHSKDNGCLQVVKKSQLMGRLNHKIVGGDTLAIDPVWMEKVLERLDIVYCEMEPGDALFLHANTIHCSGDNRTDSPRTAITCHYNAASNEPFCLEGRSHRRYRPLKRLPDTSIIDGNYTSVLNSQLIMDQGKTFEQIVVYSVKPEEEISSKNYT